MVRTDGRQLGVRLAHECLQLFLEQLVSGLGSGRLNGCLLGTVLIERTGILTAGAIVVPAEIVVIFAVENEAID